MHPHQRNQSCVQRVCYFNFNLRTSSLVCASKFVLQITPVSTLLLVKNMRGDKSKANMEDHISHSQHKSLSGILWLEFIIVTFPCQMCFNFFKDFIFPRITQIIEYKSTFIDINVFKFTFTSIWLVMITITIFVSEIICLSNTKFVFFLQE